MFDALLSSQEFWGVAGFVAGMLVGSNNPTWLSGKWKEIKEKSEKAKADENLTELASKVSEFLKKGVS